jgi:hypothetical protein
MMIIIMKRGKGKNERTEIVKNVGDEVTKVL